MTSIPTAICRIKARPVRERRTQKTRYALGVLRVPPRTKKGFLSVSSRPFADQKAFSAYPAVHEQRKTDVNPIPRLLSKERRVFPLRMACTTVSISWAALPCRKSRCRCPPAKRPTPALPHLRASPAPVRLRLHERFRRRRRQPRLRNHPAARHSKRV